MERIIIYTDGACFGNPGPGGYAGFVIQTNNGKVVSEESVSGRESHTTNNRMELRAVVESLRSTKETKKQITVFTDSKYVSDGITKWIVNWKKNNWVTSKRTPVINKDLWVTLDALRSRLNVKWKWVKGHSGDLYNDMADSLAKNEARQATNELKSTQQTKKRNVEETNDTQKQQHKRHREELLKRKTTKVERESNLDTGEKTNETHTWNPLDSGNESKEEIFDRVFGNLKSIRPTHAANKNLMGEIKNLSRSTVKELDVYVWAHSYLKNIN